MPDFPFIPLFPAEYLADTAHLTPEESGAYLHLLMHMWMQRGKLRDDPVSLAALARVDNGRWPEIWERLAPFFKRANRAHITQKRLAKELAYVTQRRNAQRVSGKRGGEISALKNQRNRDRLAQGTLKEPTPTLTLDKESPPYPPQGEGSPPVSEWSEEQVKAFGDDHGYPPVYDAEFYGPGARRRRAKLSSRERLEAARGRATT